MILRIILFLSVFLLATQQTYANYPYQRFDKRKLKISPISYTKYVIPQINGIVKDFYKIIRTNSTAGQELVLMYDKVKKAKQTFININSAEDFSTTYKDVYNQIQEVERRLLTFTDSQTNFNLPIINQQFEIIIQLNKISNLTYSLLHILEGGMILTTKEELLSYVESTNLNQNISKLIIFIKIAMLAQTPKELQDQFNFMLFNFIRPLEDYIIKHKTYHKLVSRLEEFSMTWNVFHMKLTKGNFTVSNNVKQGLRTIHARWVSILKVLLKRSLRG